MATQKTTTRSAGSKPATSKAAKATKPAKASQEQSPVSDMGAEDESATDAKRSNHKAGEAAPRSTASKPAARRTTKKD